jgi:flagellar biosynthetic protein FlhB
MADDLGQSRTEPATPRRREEARQQGQVAYSNELVSGLLLLAGVAALVVGAGTLGSGLLEAVRGGLLGSHVPDPSPERVQQIFLGLLGRGLGLVGVLLSCLFLLGLAAGTLQVGWHVIPSLTAFNWARLSPAAGAGRLFSLASSLRALLAVIKAAAVGLAAWWVLRGRLTELSALAETTLGAAAGVAWGTAMRMALAGAGVLALVGLADYLFQRWRLEQSLRMTRQELKEEIKREDGDPQIKARVRKLQREAARKRMLKEVPRATVVITNPTHLAVALRYDGTTMVAPRVVAKGAGFVARRIAELARRHAVPVVERKAVAQALYKAAKVDQQIPAALYHAVAEILAYVYRLGAGVRGLQPGEAGQGRASWPTPTR